MSWPVMSLACANTILTLNLLFLAYSSALYITHFGSSAAVPVL
jgi:hypothetical protein